MRNFLCSVVELIIFSGFIVIELVGLMIMNIDGVFLAPMLRYDPDMRDVPPSNPSWRTHPWWMIRRGSINRDMGRCTVHRPISYLLFIIIMLAYSR